MRKVDSIVNLTGYEGFQRPETDGVEYAALAFLVNSILARVNTSTLVQVVKVTNNGGVSPVGFVDVQPLVNQIDGAGNSMPHGVVHNLPYFRVQGGTNAVIMDPQVGDIGMAVFGDRDLSSVQSTGAQANPGSGRRFDMSDGLYVGGFLNGTPVQYVQFNSSGVNVVSPTKITCAAPNVEMDASTGFTVNSPLITLNGSVSQGAGSYGGTSTWNGNLTIVGILKNNGKFVGSTHTHLENGTGNQTNPPT